MQHKEIELIQLAFDIGMVMLELHEAEVFCKAAWENPNYTSYTWRVKNRVTLSCCFPAAQKTNRKDVISMKVTLRLGGGTSRLEPPS